MSLYTLFYKGFDCNDKKRWIPIFMGMTERGGGGGNDREEKTGSINRTPTLKEIKDKKETGLMNQAPTSKK